MATADSKATASYRVAPGAPLVVSQADTLDKAWTSRPGGDIALEIRIINPNSRLKIEDLWALMGGGGAGIGGGVLSDGTARITSPNKLTIDATEQNVQNWMNGNKCHNDILVTRRMMAGTSTQAADAARSGASGAIDSGILAFPDVPNGWLVQEHRDATGKITLITMVPA